MRSKTSPRPTPPPTAPKPEHPALAALKGSRWFYVLVSLLLLLPCFWQPRVQAGDLSSHIYNAWLSQLIESGQIQGLHIVTQTTNILFDLMLSGLFKLMGAEAAQRISVSVTVLVFIWGAFAFAGVVSGRKPWPVLPCIMMLAYGWVFHMGFFNFYLSLGICFWALALLWQPNPRRVAVAVVLLAVAYVAHALPVAWVAGLMAYVMVGRRLSQRARVYLIAALLTGMMLVNGVMARTLITQWSAHQITLTTGLDQMWVFDGKYYGILIALLFLWAIMFLNLIHLSDARQVVLSMPFQLCVISAGVVFILPTSILFPGFHHALAFIAERMSLGVGVCVCALLACAQPRWFERAAMVGIAIVFFAFLYHDERALNLFEDRMQDTVAALPQGQRVISAINDPALRVNALAHVIDRACVGRCYSYANYEPSTAQFRVRAEVPNPYVTSSYQDSWLMQMGYYRAKPQELPLYQVDVDATGRMVTKNVQVGVAAGGTTWDVLGGF
jgi:hypothetical protein